MSKTKNKNSDTSALFDLSFMLTKRRFDSFNDLRKESYSVLKGYREEFVKTVLKQHGIKIKKAMTKREVQDLLEANKVEIIHDEDKNVDRVLMCGKEIGYWNRDTKLFFNKAGRLMLKVEYKILK